MDGWVDGWMDGWPAYTQTLTVPVRKQSVPVTGTTRTVAVCMHSVPPPVQRGFPRLKLSDTVKPIVPHSAVLFSVPVYVLALLLLHNYVLMSFQVWKPRRTYLSYV